MWRFGWRCVVAAVGADAVDTIRAMIGALSDHPEAQAIVGGVALPVLTQTQDPLTRALARLGEAVAAAEDAISAGMLAPPSPSLPN